MVVIREGKWSTIKKNDWVDSNMSLFPIIPYLTDIVICLNQKIEIIEFNPAAEQYYEWKKANVLGKNYIELCKKNSFSYHPLLDELQTIAQRNDAQEFIDTIIIKSDQKHFASWKIIPVLDTNNKITAIFLIGKDITQEKIAEKGIKNFEKRLESVIDSIAGNHWWKDINGRYMGFNGALAKELGLSSMSEIIGKTDYDMPWADTAGELDSHDKEVIESGLPKTQEEQVLAKDGRILTFLVTKVPFRDSDGNIIGTIGTSFDITARKLAEEREKLAIAQTAEEREKIKTIKTISASIAHELRTPLRSIHAVASGMKDYFPKLMEGYELAKKANLPVPHISPIHYETLLTGCDHIESETEEAFTVIDMLLMNVSESINTRDFKVCSIHQCVNEALRRYPYDIGEAELVHWNSQNNFLFKGNELLMIHIFFNLMKNAFYQIKAAHKGEIHIWTERAGKYNLLHFKDTAKGISPKVLPHIFERFYTKTYHGTGVGLAFCKLVMENLGGKITCQSVEEQYAEFILHFPHQDSAPSNGIDTNT